LADCERLEVDRHRFVSFTGGEPLLQPEALGALAGKLRGRGPRLLLETHGLAVDALGQVVDRIDVVSMDWKLASDVRRASPPGPSGTADFHGAHERFLRVAWRAPEVIVKLVVTPASGDGEIDEACRRIARVAPQTPVVLQPVTPFAGVKERPDPRRMLELLARAERTLENVRVIPQTHWIYGVP
jgi:pyruvate-formate lyase-activating enzyme